MSERRWKRYKDAPVRKRATKDAPRVSVNPGGEITFDINPYRQMGEPQACALLYESETETIGVEPVHADEPHAIFVRSRHGRFNRVVRSRGFFLK